MIKAMFEVYDFIIKNDLEIQYIEKAGSKEDEIIVFIDPASYEEFATIIAEHFANLVSDGDYQATITTDGSLGVNIMPLIEHYCMIEDIGIWKSRYKQLGGC